MSASAADLHHHLGFVGESEKQPMETEKQPMATEAGGSGAPARGKKRPPSPDLELDTTAGDADDEWLVSDSGEEDEEDDGNQGTHGPYTVDDFPRATCEYEEQNHIMFMDPDIELRGPSPNRLFPAFKYGGHQFKSGKHLFRSDYNLCDTSKLSVTSVEDCSATCRRCSTMFLLQFINVEIAGYRHTRPGPARIYGFIAARDKIKPLRNYVYRREIGNSKALLRSQVL